MTTPGDQRERIADALRSRVLEAIAGIAFADPRRVNARDRLAALKLLGEHLGMRQEGAGDDDPGQRESGVVLIPAKSADWASLAMARETGIEFKDDAILVPDPPGEDE